MANVTRALLQPLGTHSKPHKASLALDCAPLPKEELYVTTQSLRHRRNQKGNSLGQVYRFLSKGRFTVRVQARQSPAMVPQQT